VAGPLGSVTSVGRLVSLSAVLVPLVRQGFLSRAGRFYAWMIAVVHVTLLALGGATADVRPAAVVASALRLMSLAGGVVAWGAARDSSPDAFARGFGACASERGMSGREQRLAHALSAMRVVARSVGLPGVCLVLASGIWVPEPFLAAARLALSVALYAIALGAVLGGLARLAAFASPRHGRILFAIVVVGPYAAPSELGAVPNIVRGFSTLLTHVAGLGGALR
jgi:hypothetical protein